MGPSTLPPCPSGEFWVVAAGDTIYKIANQTGRTISGILKANPKLNPENLKIGTRICLPPMKKCASGIYWTVEPGDTIYKIAKANGVSVAALRRANPGLNPNNLQIGERICIPN